MHNNYMCFTNFPKTCELLCLFATVNISDKINTSLYNTVIKKCRQLIFENNDVIAVPYLEQLYGIYIILKEKFYETGELQKYLKSHNLKAGAPTAVTKSIYEECCMYTIIAKIAPKWNIVSNYFVRGRDFLINSKPKDCIQLSLRINEKGETSMIFEISRIKLPTMSLDKLDLSDDYIKELNTNNTVAFKFHNSRTIRVLPSLKRGNILSINLKINESLSFRDYHQFRRHWKNTYGYRLPETETDIFYLQISFFEGSPIFTYPSLCVRPCEPTFVQRVEPMPVVAGFMSDLLKYVPKILGEKYPVPSHIDQPDRLFFSGTENVQLKHIGAIDPKIILDTQSSAIVHLPTQQPPQNVQNNGDCNNKSKLSQLISQINKVENNSPIYLTQNTILTAQISQTPQSLLQDKINIEISQKNDLSKPKIKANLISQEINNQFQFLSQKAAERHNMATKITPNFAKPQSSTNNNDQKKHIPKFTSKFPKLKSIKNIPDSVIKATNNTKTKKEIKLVEFEIDKSKYLDNNVEKSLFDSETRTKPFQENSLPEENNISSKRLLYSNNEEKTVAKKPRSKPVAMEVNNMEVILNSGEIEKLNIQSLLRWLKENNIPCTTREKKSVLIEKIKNNFKKQ